MQAACTWPAPSDGWDIERCHSAVWQEAEALLERLGSEGDAAIMVTDRPKKFQDVRCFLATLP